METLASERDPYGDAKPSKIRLKSKSKSSSRSKRRHDGDEGDERPHKRTRSRDSKRRRRHHSSRTIHDHTFPRNGEYDDPDHRHRESLYDGIDGNDITSPDLYTADPDEAFRESLFDALADDEGAAYWEGVYGQPVHVYPNTKTGPDGKLERMGDEEYAEYVRTKMWEKSHQHVLEEREARERARKRDKDRRREMEEETSKQEEEREEIRRKMKESLRRGEERKKAKDAEAAWSVYEKKWEDLRSRKDIDGEDALARELIPWPVVSGKWKHATKEDIEYFFECSPAWKADPTALLKIERVRWHPDKMQQRFGQHIDPDTMKGVTAVFQVVDRLWNERRK